VRRPRPRTNLGDQWKASSRTPRLLPLQVLIPVAIATAFALAAVVYWFISTWLFGQPLRSSPSNVDEQKLSIEIGKAALGMAAAAGAVAALVVGYRRARLDHAQSLRDDTRLFTERYGAASEQLGGSNAAVRLAGVYALAQLADDWEEQRQTCVDVLCAYLRMPYDPATAPPGEREVRWTIFRVFKARLIDPESPTSWCHLDFDFSGTVFDGGGLARCQFTGKYLFFVGADFRSGHVDLRRVGFRAGRVDFTRANFGVECSVDFTGSVFAGDRVTFDGAIFQGQVNLDDVDFLDADVDFGSILIPTDTLTLFTGAKLNEHSAETLSSLKNPQVQEKSVNTALER
jgi:hypothetical protein